MPEEFTPYNDDYSGCERAVAKLLIYSGELDPAKVTLRLGIQPTKAIAQGHIYPSGREQPLNFWSLSSEGVVKSLDLRRHLDWLLRILSTKAEELTALRAESGVAARIHCHWWATGTLGALIFSPMQTSQLAELNLECSVELSFYEPEEWTGQ